MFPFIALSILAIVALAASANPTFPRPVRVALVVLAPLLVVAGFLIGSSVIVPADRSGIVHKHVGPALAGGAIVARNGEQGPQAEILGPGWHFGYLPFLYEVETVPVAVIEHGKLGFITAKDGASLGEGKPSPSPGNPRRTCWTRRPS